MQETEWLDFKTLSTGNDENKTTWSEAIAGFANNQGGVLIWGVSTRKNERNIDCGSELKPLDNVHHFQSRLSEWLRGAAEPPVTGVQIAVINETEATGYVICFIPESRIKPHRAELAKYKPYVIRVSDNFVVPSVAMLRSLFYPGSSPQLRSIWRADWSVTPANERVEQAEIRIRLWLENVGIATARDVYCIFS